MSTLVAIIIGAIQQCDSSIGHATSLYYRSSDYRYNANVTLIASFMYLNLSNIYFFLSLYTLNSSEAKQATSFADLFFLNEAKRKRTMKNTIEML